jgi:8-oxo-dGTP pyrophosphatase MutT (NUDIX family)
MQIVSWFSAAIIWRINPENGELEFLVVEHKWKPGNRFPYFPPRMKFPGGKMGTDASPEITLHREIEEETGLRLKPGARVMAFFNKTAPVPEAPAYLHEKRFSVISYEDLEGEIRKVVKEDQSSILMPPVWRRAEGIELYGGHRKAARSSVKFLKRRVLQAA